MPKFFLFASNNSRIQRINLTITSFWAEEKKSRKFYCSTFGVLVCLWLSDDESIIMNVLEVLKLICVLFLFSPISLYFFSLSPMQHNYIQWHKEHVSHVHPLVRGSLSFFTLTLSTVHSLVRFIFRHRLFSFRFTGFVLEIAFVIFSFRGCRNFSPTVFIADIDIRATVSMKVIRK